MDVQCDRCKTEYEFDDALVSGRGTTVRCTNCGHQFKVRQAQGAAAPDDRWVVRTSDGEQVTFLTLRDLQQAILSRQIRRADALLRGTGAPRPLGSISELDPFFEGRTSSRPPPVDPASGENVSTKPVPFPKPIAWPGEGAAIPAAVAGAPAPGVSAKAPELYRPPPIAPPTPAIAPPPPMRQKVDTLRPPLTDAAVPPPPEADALPSTSALFPPPPQAADPMWVPERTKTTGVEGLGLLPPPTQPVRRSVSPFEDDALSLREGPPPSSSVDPYSVPRRRRVGGWIVALVLLLAVGVVGWALAKPYLVTHDSGAAAGLDPRLGALLSDGEKAMSEGRLDVAQGDFDKASVLAEKDSRVLVDEARVAAAEADVPWLKLRLLPSETVDEVRTTKAELDEIVARARRFSDDAVAVAPVDVAAVRTKIDALRLAGERDAAREYVPRVIAQASQPETSYVLAALDLAEPVPLWTTIIDRLRLSAGAEGGAGRAQAALIYALAKSGEVPAAKLELAKLEALARPYPLLPSLHDFLERASPVPSGAGSAAGARPAPSSRASAGAAGTPPAGSSAPGAPVVGPSAGRGPGSVAAAPTTAVAPNMNDPRAAMQAAAQALKRADFAAARQIYQGIVERNPTDSEAIAGLGDVARLQADPSAAISAYKRAIAVNPSYLPALLGLADTEWEGGDRVSAVKTYSDIVDRFPEGTYPRYVTQRAGEGASSGSSMGPGASTATPQSAGASNERAE